MPRSDHEPRLWLLATTLVVVGAGAAFWVPGFARARPHLPVPLDDVYIHFGFARSAALGVRRRWPGAHLAVGRANTRAVRFYTAYGFRELALSPHPVAGAVWMGIALVRGGSG